MPAHAEMVIEGYVVPGEEALEGPFGDHTGYYSMPDMYPVLHVTCITQRRYPIYPTIIVGRPPMEDYYMGKVTERIFLPIIQMILPEVVDINMPAEGVFHNLVIVSIKKEYPGQARKVMYGLWGMGLMSLAKTIIVVDHFVNVHDPSEVTWRVTNNLDPSQDILFASGPLDDLDHASPTLKFGSKIGIDRHCQGPDGGPPAGVAAGYCNEPGDSGAGGQEVGGVRAVGGMLRRKSWVSPSPSRPAAFRARLMYLP